MISLEAFKSATPPPIVTPSKSATLVALTASSTRYFLSSISISEEPPTEIVATLPIKEATRFFNWSFSKSDCDDLICSLIRLTLFLTAKLEPLPETIIVSICDTIIFLASPKTSILISSNLVLDTSVISFAPVRTAKSSITAFL